jgi:hypothetical protein
MLSCHVHLHHCLFIMEVGCKLTDAHVVKLHNVYRFIYRVCLYRFREHGSFRLENMHSPRHAVAAALFMK